MPIGLLALSLAAFAIGTNEFIIAGVLPDISAEFGVSIPTTGLLITVYALAVAIGGPILAMLTSGVPRKPMIVFLLSVFALGQVFCALAPSYDWLMAGRIFTACTHGLFFGAGSVAAVELVGAQKRGMAMALFLGGITLANLFGIPAGTAVGNAFGWRWAFWLVGACGLLAAFLVARVLPRNQDQQQGTPSLAREIRALNHQQIYLSYLVIALTMVGSLAFATYQVPALIAVTHVAQERTPFYLIVSGVGAIIGIYAGGRAGDWKLMPSLLTILIAQASSNVILTLAMPQAPAMVISIFIFSATAWALNAPVQSRILAAAQDAPHLASTLVSTAYNIGIGAGAWVGALWIDAGLGFQRLPAIGVICSLLAAGVASISWRLDDHDGAGQSIAVSKTLEP